MGDADMGQRAATPMRLLSITRTADPQSFEIRLATAEGEQRGIASITPMPGFYCVDLHEPLFDWLFAHRGSKTLYAVLCAVREGRKVQLPIDLAG
jgi:hypothetical protein